MIGAILQFFSKLQSWFMMCTYLITFMNNHGKAQEDSLLFVFSPSHSGRDVPPFLMTDVQRPQVEIRESLLLCTWAYLEYFKRPSVIFSIQDHDSNVWEISFGIVPMAFIVRVRDTTKVISITTIPLLSWNHLCVSILEKSVDFFRNGDLLISVPFRGSELLAQELRLLIGGGMQWPPIPPRTDGAIKIIDDFFGLNNPPVGSFAGKIFLPEIYLQKNLSTNLMQNLSNCLSSSNVSATPLQWTKQGNNIRSLMALKSLPCDSEKKILLSPKPLSSADNYSFCSKLKLQMVVHNSMQNYNSILKLVKPYKTFCGFQNKYFWLKTSNNNLFGKCEALTDNGKELLNCERQLCSGCEHPIQKRPFILRGFCSIQVTDLSFILKNDTNQMGYIFHGIEQYSISLVNDQWELRDNAKNVVVANTLDSEDPVGVKYWKLQNQFCGKNNSETILASLTNCNSDEAFCNNGECMHLSKKCDSIIDCKDASDENDCDPIIFPKNYLTTIPPAVSPVTVKIVLNTIKIKSLPPDKPFSFLLETVIQYQDPRLQIANLYPGTSSSIVNVSRLWRPVLSLMSPDCSFGLDHSTEIQLTHGYQLLSEKAIVKLSSFIQSTQESRESFMNERIHDGANSTISLSSLGLFTSDCSFNLAFFPFDHQICQVIFLLKEWPSSVLRVDPNSLISKYSGLTHLMQFTVLKTEIKIESIRLNNKLHSGINMSIYLSRQPGIYVFSLYFPSTILVVINICSLWMTTTNRASSRLIMNSVSLIMCTLLWILLRVSYTGCTGYLTAIDMWLCFCTAMSLLILSAHILLDIFVNEADSASNITSRENSVMPTTNLKDVRPIDPQSFYDGLRRKLSRFETNRAWLTGYWILLIAKVVIPSLFVIFNSIYWPFIMYFSRQ